MINRRKMLQGMAAAAVSAPLLPSLAQASSVKSKPKRVIFFLQNNGFHTDTCIPLGMKSSASLSGAKLPESIKPLEPYLEKISIINDLQKKNNKSLLLMGASPVLIDFLESILYLCWNETNDIKFSIFTVNSF